MAITVSKTGPYFDGGVSPSNTTNIKFSQIRDTFKGGLPTDAISASELLRDIDTSSRDPIVPDCTENSAIGSSTNWSVSQFLGSIKYYDMTFPASDPDGSNFDIAAQNWNSNLGKTIKKKFYMNGDSYATNSGSGTTPFALDSALKVSTTATNLTIELEGNIKGAGGLGGPWQDNFALTHVGGQSGGGAIQLKDGYVVINMGTSASVWGGGGGGELGAFGANGDPGTCRDDYTISWCPGHHGTSSCSAGYTMTSTWGGGCCHTRRKCWWSGWGKAFCWHECTTNSTLANCRKDVDSLAPPGGAGGEGGNGEGYSQSQENGTFPGDNSSDVSCTSFGPDWFRVSGTGDRSDRGETGGNGGYWGVGGANTTNTGNGGAAGPAVFATNGATYVILNDNTTNLLGPTPGRS